MLQYNGGQSKLKYLFTAEYKDGTIYKQNPEDVSISDKKRSCFFDVKQEELRKFSLCGQGNIFSVNLEDGHFEINNVPFFLEEHIEGREYRIIFWREHTHTLNPATREETHKIVYLLGWQTNGENGRNIQRILRIE